MSNKTECDETGEEKHEKRMLEIFFDYADRINTNV